jgi:hypothetical protein
MLRKKIKQRKEQVKFTIGWLGAASLKMSVEKKPELKEQALRYLDKMISGRENNQCHR